MWGISETRLKFALRLQNQRCTYTSLQDYKLIILKDLPPLPFPLALTQSPFPQAWDTLGRKNPPHRQPPSPHTLSPTLGNNLFGSRPLLLPRYLPTPHHKAAARRSQSWICQTSSTHWWHLPGRYLVALRSDPALPQHGTKSPVAPRQSFPKDRPLLKPLLPQEPATGPSFLPPFLPR